jgi:hypothetical protein
MHPPVITNVRSVSTTMVCQSGILGHSLVVIPKSNPEAFLIWPHNQQTEIHMHEFTRVFRKPVNSVNIPTLLLHVCRYGKEEDAMSWSGLNGLSNPLY